MHLLQVDGDDERCPHHDQPLEVLGDQREVADPVSKQTGREQRFPAGAFQPADVGVEPEQERDADHHEGNEQCVVDAGLQDPEHDEEHPDRRQDGAHQVEVTGRIGG
jgi:hypothetical protein